jgi:L,D-peptidoglycan transpeptidase YkuD (ErfK/YbiS/YcfS/YnhG family)
VKKEDNNRIIVDPSGKLFWRGEEYRCVLGSAGIKTDKKEGDGATPAGCFLLREILYRADRVQKPKTKLPVRALTKNDGWCDDSTCIAYNRLVQLPHRGSHEKLWREDDVYDIIAVVGYNDDPPVPGNGSAIFMHIAREGYSPTAGCVALAKDDLLRVLASVPNSVLLCIKNK